MSINVKEMIVSKENFSDKVTELNTLTEKFDTIKKYQKYVNTDIGYAYIAKNDNIGVVPEDNDILIPNIGFGNLQYDLSTGTITLLPNRIYQVALTLRVSTGERISIYLKDLNTNTTLANSDYLNVVTQLMTTGWSGKDLNTIIETGDDEVQLCAYVRSNIGSTTYTTFTMSVHEIGRRSVIDPIEHTNKTNGIEDTPVGHIIAHMGTVAPTHYLICDGTEYNITDYPYLAQHIEDNFGSINYFGGDGETTFAVPDLRERFLKGVVETENVGVNEEAGLPNITGTIGQHGVNSGTTIQNLSGAFYTTTTLSKYRTGTDKTGANSVGNIYINASRSSAIYGKSSTVTPANTSVLYCIKYEPTYYMQNIYTGYEEVTLYEGETRVPCSSLSTTVDLTISLIDSIENYDEIKIYYGTYSSSGIGSSECKILKPIDIMNHFGVIFLSSHWSIVRMAIQGNFTDASTLNIVSSGLYVYKEGATTSNLGIVVYRIVGCKTSYNEDGSLTGIEYVDEDINNTINELW